MSENEMWTIIWKCVVTILCVLIVSAASCTANRHYQTRILVESGKVDGLGAKCALDSDSGAVCLNMAVRDMVNNRSAR